MSNDDNSKKQITILGGNFMTILFLIFLVLKLAEIGPVAKWSWWWVTSPLWIPAAFAISILVILLITAFLIKLINNK